MGLLIVNADFVGKYELPKNIFITDKIDKYIAQYEENYLRKLLGVTLFDLFKADVAGFAPVTDIYLNIFNPIYQDYNTELKISEGMKKMLLGFLYFEITRDFKFKQTMSGPAVNQSETSNIVDLAQANIYGRYNEAVNSYETIQWYIRKNKTATVYETFNGQCKTVASEW